MDYTMILGAAASVAGPCVISWLAGDTVGSARTRRRYEAAMKETSLNEEARTSAQESNAVDQANASKHLDEEAYLEDLIHGALLRQQRRAALARAPILAEPAQPVGAVWIVDDALVRAEDHRPITMPARHE